MEILEIKPPYKHKCKIVTTVGEMVLNVDTVQQYGLKKGVILTKEQADGLAVHSEYTSALSKGSWLLSQRDYTKKGLFDKLKPDFGDDAAEYAVEKLQEVGALDDERYARLYAEYSVEYKGLSRRAVEQELRKKGIDRETARAAADELDFNEVESAVGLIKSKYADYRRDEKIYRRMTAALVRRGFSYSTINEAVRSIEDEREYE